MPELPEVETVRRGLQTIVEGARILRIEQRRADLRFPIPSDFAPSLEKSTVTSITRRAKYLLFHTDTKLVLITHLGMSGSLRIEDGQSPHIPGAFHLARSKSASHDHVIMHVQTRNGKTARIVYNDPRRFGFMLLCPESELADHPMLAKLGIEPTGNSFNGEALAMVLRNRNTSLKSALMDQRLIAGLGNIYVCEALWRAGLSPRRTALSIVPKRQGSGARADRLAQAIRMVLGDAIASGGSSLRDHRQADGSLGYFQHSFAVYDREGAPCQKAGCDGIVLRFDQAGRSTFHCPKCQR